MDAPTYPQAVAFEQPTAPPYVLRLEDFSLAELMKMPAAWDIVLKHMPSINMMTGSAMIKPHLGNFSVFSLSAFGWPVSPDLVATIDKELALLSSVQGATP